STGFIGECIVGFQFDCLVEAGQGFLETPESEQRVASIVMGVGGARIDSDCLVEKFKAAFELAALALNHAEQVHGIKMVWIGLQYLFAKIPRFSEFALLEQGNGLLKERLCVTVAVHSHPVAAREYGRAAGRPPGVRTWLHRPPRDDGYSAQY